MVVNLRSRQNNVLIRRHFWQLLHFLKIPQIFQILTDFHNFSCTTSQENAKVIGVKNLSPHIRCVATIPCESLRHKSNTFHTNISTLHMFISITFTETSIDETNKTQQKVKGSKCMFKMSTIHANTCIQTTTPPRNR